MSRNTVEILLATHNGHKHLEEQLQSILNQTFQDFLITIRDDASSDGTREILDRFSHNYPDKIRVFLNNEIPEGPIRNFSKLITLSKFDYIMLSDQDDFWLPKKIENTVKALKSLQKEHGDEIPLLVHTDLKVTDAGLNVIGGSFWKFVGINPRNSTLNRLLIQNVVTGSTTMFNRRLAELCVPIPDEACMHDWWLALIASGMGRISYLKEPTVLYRQHESNMLGAKKYSLKISILINRVIKLYELGVLVDNKLQAKTLLKMYKDKLGKDHKEQLEIFSNIDQYGFLRKRYLFLKYGLMKSRFLQNLGLLIFFR